MDKTFRPTFFAAALAVIAVLAVLAGCEKAPPKAVVLAQVGDATLTLDELRESFPAEYEQLIRREQYLDFIKRWIDDEAVYQQAIKSKLESDPVVGRKLEKLRRKVLIEEFLSRENAAEVFEPDEMAMNQYYEMHKEDFRRKAPEFKIAHIRTQTSKLAADLRYKANRGDFLAVAAANSLDPVPESYASIAFKRLTEFPPCLAQDIADAGVGSVSMPVACADGFYLVKVLEKQDAGSLIPLAEAKEEITAILVMDRKDKLLDGRVAKFKEGLDVSYHLDLIPGLEADGEGAQAAAVAGGSAAASKPVASPAASALAAPALPREPAPAAPSAAMPREPGAPVPAAAPDSEERSRRYAPRKRRPAAASPRAGDSTDAKAAAKPAAEPAPDSPAPKPVTEENADAQNPTPAP